MADVGGQEPLIAFGRDMPMSLNETLYRDQRNDAYRRIEATRRRIEQHLDSGLLRDDVATDLRALLAGWTP